MEKQTEQSAEQREEFRKTNQKFAENDEQFRNACELVGLKPTTRQASKWRMKRGKAWKASQK